MHKTSACSWKKDGFLIMTNAESAELRRRHFSWGHARSGVSAPWRTQGLGPGCQCRGGLLEDWPTRGTREPQREGAECDSDVGAAPHFWRKSVQYERLHFLPYHAKSWPIHCALLVWYLESRDPKSFWFFFKLPEESKIPFRLKEI